MLLRKKERILAYLRSGFGQDPLQSGASQLCRERLPQIGILYNTFRKEEPEKAFCLDDITWSDLEMDEVTGLTLGADDFLTKPSVLLFLEQELHPL